MPGNRSETTRRTGRHLMRVMRRILRFSGLQPVLMLSLTVGLAMSAAYAGDVRLSSDALKPNLRLDPADDLLSRGAYSVGPVIDRASSAAGHDIAPGGEIVRVEIDETLQGLTARRAGPTETGRVRITHLGSGASVVARVVVGFDLNTPIGLSADAAKALGMTDMRRPMLIERAR